MDNYPIAVYLNPPGFYFEYKTAAMLASVSVQFIHQCENADLIACQTMLHGRRGLSFTDVQKLKLLRHFHEDMGVPLDALDFLLLYRKRIKEMSQEIEEMKRYIRLKERIYKAEIVALRRHLHQEIDFDDIF